MGILREPKLREIKLRFEKVILDFVNENAEEVLRQADADIESEVPEVPLFDNYLLRLEPEIRNEVIGAGYFNGTATRLFRDYKNYFYYSLLPNISYNLIMQRKEE